VVQRDADDACLLVRLLPGGSAEQATKYVAEPSGRCHQDLVASMASASASYASASLGSAEDCPMLGLVDAAGAAGVE
jgi:hypothetical protein